MKKYLLICLLLCMVVASEALGQVRLQGTVESKEQGMALSGAHIMLNETYRVTITDANGRFSFKDLKPGKYTIRVSHLGYATYTDNLDIQAEKTIHIRLETQAILEEEVIVRSTRAGISSPTTFTRISKKDVAHLNLGQDLPYLLDITPSAVTTSDAGSGIGYTGIRIRGTDMSRINVTINGIPLNDPESQNVFWVNMPDFGSSVEDIQIQRGIGTSTNGASSFGASINIQTQRVVPDPYAEVNLSAGSFNTFKQNIRFGTGLINSKFSFEGRLSHIRSDGYIDRSASSLYSYFLTAGFLTKNSLTRFNLISGREKTQQAWDGIPSAILDTNRTWNGIGAYTDENGATQYYQNETDNYQQIHYQLLHTSKLSNHLVFNASIFYIHGDGYYEQYKPDQKLQKYNIPLITIADTIISRTDLIRQKQLDNDFYGLTWALQYEQRATSYTMGGAWHQYEGLHQGEVIWGQYLGIINPSHRWYENKGTKKEMNVYLKATHQVHSHWGLFGDIQYRQVGYSIRGMHDDLRDLTQSHAHYFWGPKGGVQYVLNDKNQMYASVALTSREPSRSDYRDAKSGRFPKPEHLLNFETGHRLNHNKVRINTNLYFMGYRDQLVLTGEINDVGAPMMTNVPTSYRAGVEFSGKIFISRTIHWEANASVSRSRIKDFTAYVDDWDTYAQVSTFLGETPIAFSPDLVAFSRFSYHAMDALSLELLSKYVSKQYIDNTGDASRSLDPYVYHNLNIAYNLSIPKFSVARISLLINNLLNTEYETNAWVYRYLYTESGTGVKQEGILDGYFPQASRHFLLGMQLKF